MHWKVLQLYLSDENQIRVLDLSEAVIKPVTSMMSRLSEMMVKVQCSHWKVKVGGQFVSSNMAHDAQACLLEYEELLLHKEDANGKQPILKKQFGENNSCWEAICFQAEAWIYHNHSDRKYSGV